MGVSKASISSDHRARILAAAAALQPPQRQQEREQSSVRQERNADTTSQNISSVFTPQPIIVNDGSPAMRWAIKYDRAAREAYLVNNASGKGLASYCHI